VQVSNEDKLSGGPLSGITVLDFSRVLAGPMSDLPSYDMVVQAIGGVMSLTGWPAERPARVGTSFGNLGAALFGVIGSLAALYKRTQNAQGERSISVCSIVRRR